MNRSGCMGLVMVSDTMGYPPTKASIRTTNQPFPFTNLSGGGRANVSRLWSFALLEHVVTMETQLFDEDKLIYFRMHISNWWLDENTPEAKTAITPLQNHYRTIKDSYKTTILQYRHCHCIIRGNAYNGLYQLCMYRKYRKYCKYV